MITTGHLGAAIRQHWHAFTEGERPPERLSFLLLTLVSLLVRAFARLVLFEQALLVLRELTL